MIDGEEKRNQEGGTDAIPRISVESLERADREGLCREESIDIFLTWYAFGGMDQGFTFTEVLEMPVWLRKDLRFIFSELGARRKQRKALQEAGKLYEGNAPKRKRKPNARKR